MAREWLDLHNKRQSVIAYSAQKPVPKSSKSENIEHPAGSSPLCPHCGSNKLWATAYGIPCSGTVSSAGSVASVDSDFQIPSMLRRLGARLNVLKELIPNRKKPQKT